MKTGDNTFFSAKNRKLVQCETVTWTVKSEKLIFTSINKFTHVMYRLVPDDVGQGKEAVPWNGWEGQGSLRLGNAKLCATEGGCHWTWKETKANQGSKCAEEITVCYKKNDFIAGLLGDIYEFFSSFICSFFSSAFFWFCNDERTKVKALNPEYGVGDIAKELGKKWSDVEPSTKSKYEAMAEKDKKRYEVVSTICFSHLLLRLKLHTQLAWGKIISFEKKPHFFCPRSTNLARVCRRMKAKRNNVLEMFQSSLRIYLFASSEWCNHTSQNYNLLSIPC